MDGFQIPIMVHVLQQRHDIEVESLCMITTGYVLVLHYKVLNFIATANDTLILSVPVFI